MSAALVEAWLRAAAADIHQRRTELTELDGAIGDGDHGINMDRGFQAIVAGLDAATAGDATGGSLLVAAGRTIMGTVGGASGALYGRAFDRAGTRLQEPAAPGGKDDPLDAILAAFMAATAAIAALGHASAGDKTMLDALLPAMTAASAAQNAGRSSTEMLSEAAASAEAGALLTTPMLARKGRASYLGERSIGHQDPGATSSALLLTALARVAHRLGTPDP